MRMRPFGRTGLEVSEVGFGAWAIGGKSYGPVDKEASLRALAAAEELGCNFVDTAAVYGASEEILGEFLRDRRDKWLVATKYSGQDGGLLPTAEEQLRRLGVEAVDFYQLHWAPPRGDPLYDDLRRLKDSGKARFVGVSLYTANDLDIVLDQEFIDGFQVSLNLLEPRPFLERIERIREERPAVVVRSSLRSGFLTGKYGTDARFSDPDDNRSKLSAREIADVVGMVERFRFLSETAPSMTAAAARYPLSFPEVSTVILGTKSPAQASENFGVVPGDVFGEDVLAAIRRIQDEEGLLSDAKVVEAVRTAKRALRSAWRRVRRH